MARKHSRRQKERQEKSGTLLKAGKEVRSKIAQKKDYLKNIERKVNHVKLRSKTRGTTDGEKTEELGNSKITFFQITS